MSRLPRLTGKEILSALTAVGFEVVPMPPERRIGPFSYQNPASIANYDNRIHNIHNCMTLKRLMLTREFLDIMNVSC
jgi:hypothetical protein